jgi:catechol 2,3-dioxygenase-like lactoylglutathione lyase family enzyme
MSVSSLRGRLAVFTSAFPILTTADLDRSLGFYRDLLGFEVTYRFPAEGPPTYVSLRLGDSEIGLGENTGMSAAASAHFQLCVYADDCAEAVEHLRAHGVTILGEPVVQPWGERMATVADPDGHRAVIMSQEG